MRFRNDVDRPRGWKRSESSKWFCFKCEEIIPGSSNELIYVADMDYVYHIHGGKSSFRALKVEQTKKGLRVSLPGVEFDGTDPSTLTIAGITAHTIDTPNLSQYSSTSPKKKQRSFQTIEDTERIKSVIESHPSGISRKNIARELRMSPSKVGKIVREILDSDSKYQEVKDGKESLIRTESIPDWWKSLKERDRVNDDNGATPYISLHGSIMDDHPLMYPPILGRYFLLQRSFHFNSWLYLESALEHKINASQKEYLGVR